VLVELPPQADNTVAKDKKRPAKPALMNLFIMVSLLFLRERLIKQTH
jgi:hypothetical protein